MEARGPSALRSKKVNQSEPVGAAPGRACGPCSGSGGARQVLRVAQRGRSSRRAGLRPPELREAGFRRVRRRHPRGSLTGGGARTSPMPDEPVLVITGASSGIGGRPPAALRSSGCAWYWRPAPRSVSRSWPSELGGPDRAVAATCDVTSWEDQQSLVERTLDQYGRMDAFFANAGFGVAATSGNVEHWKAMIDTGTSTAALSRSARPWRIPSRTPAT